MKTRKYATSVGVKSPKENTTLTQFSDESTLRSWPILHGPGMYTRLIDHGLILSEASSAGFAERYERGKTSHTLHVYWARRPHAAMRALVYSTLSKNISEKSLTHLNILSNSSYDTKTLDEIRQSLRSEYGGAPPKVLDMFAGGGTIPYEGATLGAEVYSIDSNPLSVFIQRATLLYPSNVDSESREAIVSESGNRILERLKKDTEWLFPLRKLDSEIREGVCSYLWTYSISCDECGYKFYLMKRPLLSKKKGKDLFLKVRNRDFAQDLEVSENYDEHCSMSPWKTGGKHKISCPKCQNMIKSVKVNLTNDELVATVVPSTGNGKVFKTTFDNPIPTDAEMDKKLQRLMHDLQIEFPKVKLPNWPGIVNPSVYGIENHYQLFNRRQLLVLIYMIKELREEYDFLSENKGVLIANFAVTTLIGLMEQLIDWNNRLSMWISQNEQVGRAFSGPGIPMLWDYAETDPVSIGPSNLYSKLDRILSGIRHLSIPYTRLSLERGFAQKMDSFAENTFDAIVTDPPYFDNLYYDVLADCFYVWEKLVMDRIEPELFKDESTHTKFDLVASKFGKSSQTEVVESYTENLSMALKEASRVLRADGIFSILFSHSSLSAWISFIRAFRSSNLFISSVLPLNIERKQRPRAMTSRAINASMVFVSRKLNEKKNPLQQEELFKQLDAMGGLVVRELTRAEWLPMEVGLAYFSQCVGILANHSVVLGAEREENILLECERIVQTRVPEFKLQVRDSL